MLSITLRGYNGAGVIATLSDAISDLKQNCIDHRSALIERRRQLVRPNNYGFVDESAWDKERYSFASGVISSSGSVSEGALGFALNKLIATEIVNICISDYSNAIVDVSADMAVSNHHKGIEYESECKTLLEVSGWEVFTTSVSGDKGADLITQKNSLRIAIQCKNWSSPAGTSAVQEVAAAKTYYEADIALLMMEVGLTTQAQDLADKLGVIAVHKTDIPSLEFILIRSLLSKS
jgi:restriction system protein